MNKATKGALAAAAAAAILAGGAGTMAAWNASTPGTGGGTITAGSLNVEQQDGTGVWKWADSGATIADIEDVVLVPGDSVVYTATYDVTLVGTNLTAELKPSLGGITGDLAGLLNVTNTGGGTTTVTKSDSYPVSTTITFDEARAGVDGGMNKTASLAGATVTLTQQ